MKEYKVLIGLKTGKEYSFIGFRESKKEIINEIKLKALNRVLFLYYGSDF